MFTIIMYNKIGTYNNKKIKWFKHWASGTSAPGPQSARGPLSHRLHLCGPRHQKKVEHNQNHYAQQILTTMPLGGELTARAPETVPYLQCEDPLIPSYLNIY